MTSDAPVLDAERFEKVSSLILPRITGLLTFDIYLQINPQKFTKVFSKGTSIETERLESYILKGTQHFYILDIDREAFLKVTSQLLEKYRETGDFDHEEAQHILDETAAKVLNQIFSSLSLNEETLSHSRTVIKSYIEITKSHSKAMPAVLRLAKLKPHLIRHSIMSSIFSTLLARAWDPGDPKLWSSAALCGFLHDVGLGQIKSHAEEHDRQLIPNVRKEVQTHPQESLSVLKNSSLPKEITEAIFNHHENWDGTGYPKGIEKESIPLLSRIVAIAEQFSSLISDTANGQALSPSLAYRLLQQTNKVDPNLCRTFGDLLHLS